MCWVALSLLTSVWGKSLMELTCFPLVDDSRKGGNSWSKKPAETRHEKNVTVYEEIPAATTMQQLCRSCHVLMSDKRSTCQGKPSKSHQREHKVQLSRSREPFLYQRLTTKKNTCQLHHMNGILSTSISIHHCCNKTHVNTACGPLKTTDENRAQMHSIQCSHLSEYRCRQVPSVLTGSAPHRTAVSSTVKTGCVS